MDATAQRKPPFAAFVSLLAILMPLKLSARVTVTTPNGERLAELDSSRFHYYGYRASKTALYDLESTFLVGEDLCKPIRATVEAKIVISDQSKTTCDLEDIYGALLEAGAAAFVLVGFWGPPGLLCYMFHDWDRPYTDGSMAMVDVSRFQLDKDIFERWRTSGMDGARLTISSPMNTEFQKTYNSFLWWFLMRSFLPLAALWTSGETYVEYRRLCRINSSKKNRNHQRAPARRISTIVVLHEMPCLIATSLMLALGGYGNCALPHKFILVFFFQFSGTSFFTTFLVAMLIRSDVQWMTRKTVDRRDVLRHFRVVIALTWFITCGWDAVVASIAATPNAIKDRGSMDAVLVVTWSLLTLGQGIAGVFFIAQARSLSVLCFEYAKYPATHRQPRNERKIHRLVTWVWCLGAASCVSTAVLIFFTSSIARGHNDLQWGGAYSYLFSYFIFVLTRIAVAFAQVTY